MEQITVIEFLISFFNLFKAKIEEYQITNKKILGTISWSNEEEQNFIFNNIYNESTLSILKNLCNYIYKYKLNNGDKLNISESELIHKLIYEGWNKIEAINAIYLLCDLEVTMLDDDEETDSFFVHF